MQDAQHLFRAALKIVGVITIIWSFTRVVSVIFQFLSVYNDSGLMPNHMLFPYRFSLLFTTLVPIILFAIGVYLIKNGEPVIKLAFKGVSNHSEKTVETIFVLFIKIVGFVLIILSIPKVLHFISSIIFASSVHSTETNYMLEPILNNLIPAIVYLVIGLYLLISGRLFYQLAFSKS